MVANHGAVKSLVVETGLAGGLVITIFDAMIGPLIPVAGQAAGVVGRGARTDKNIRRIHPKHLIYRAIEATCPLRTS